MVVSAGPRVVRAPRGSTISCRGWGQEAALRMLMNNLDPDVAERPDDLVVYGGTGRAARSWEAFDAIVRELRDAGRRRDAPGRLGQAGGRASGPTHGRRACSSPTATSWAAGRPGRRSASWSGPASRCTGR